MKKLIIAVLCLTTYVAISACEKKTTVIQEGEKTKEEPGVQFKMKTGESGTEVEMEGKTEK